MLAVLPDIGVSEEDKQAQARAALDEAFKPVIDILDKYFIDDERMDKVIDYALNLLLKHMKPARIARKTIEYFKLKPLADAAN